MEDESFGITQNLGPYNQTGPGDMTKHTVNAVLQRDRNYTMSVTLESAGKVLKSTNYYFGKMSVHDYFIFPNNNIAALI